VGVRVGVGRRVIAVARAVAMLVAAFVASAAAEATGVKCGETRGWSSNFELGSKISSGVPEIAAVKRE
jgi:hypothetical protein